MNIQTNGAQRPATSPAKAPRRRRRTLFLPLALASRGDPLPPPAETALSGQDLRRIVAGMIG